MQFGKLALATFSLVTWTATSHAQIVGGSNILTNADVATLSGYLGEGPLQLTNIFSHVNGDGQTSTDFHTAVDGKGRTFSVEKVTAYNFGANPFMAIIGGYDPLSWESTFDFHVSPTNAERTAFLYNLTTGTGQKQNLIGQGRLDDGRYQTYNGKDYGPMFGTGEDIYTDNTLNGGFTYNLSYGGTSFVTNILGNPNGTYLTQGLVYSNLEVFTIVPEPSSLALLASFCLTGAGFLARRRKQAHKAA